LTKIVLVLKHKTKGETKELVYRNSLRFAAKLGKHLRSWSLVKVIGDDNDPLVKYMRSQITLYDQDASKYKFDRKELFGIVAKESKVSVDQLKDSFKLLPKKIKSQLYGEKDE